MAFLKRLCSVALSRPRTFSMKHTTNVVNNELKDRLPYLKELQDSYMHVWKDPNPSQEVWEDVRKQVLNCLHVTPDSVDAKIMDICFECANIDGVVSYYKFLKDKNHDLHLAIIGKYFYSLYHKTDSLTIADKMDVIHTYNKIRKQYQYLDIYTIKLCVRILCLMDNWEEAYKLMKEYETVYKFNISIYNSLTSATFRNGKLDLGFELINKVFENGYRPVEDIYITYAQYCLKDEKTFKHNIEEMFKLWRKYSVVVSLEVMEKYVCACREMHFLAEYTTIKKNNSCSHCNEILSTEVLSSEEYKELSEAILHKGLINNDVYKKSTPQELANFIKFVSETKPYDIVVDGLNVHYHNGSPTLQHVVDYFSNRNCVILILTRKHLRNSDPIKEAKKSSFVYLLNNTSDDDLFLLYATLMSGQNAKFISLDLMRQHKHKLQNQRLKDIFKRWQLTHQYGIKNIRGLRSRIDPPWTVDPRAQKDQNCWHIPYKPINSLEDTYEYPELWVCIRI